MHGIGGSIPPSGTTLAQVGQRCERGVVSMSVLNVWHHGNLVVFHCNKRSHRRGFIYLNGRRLYGSIAEVDLSFAFTPNRAAKLDAGQSLESVNA